MKKLSKGWILFLVCDAALAVAIILIVVNKG